MIIYSEKVIEHFMCSQNAHSMPDAGVEGNYGDPSCGDYLTLEEALDITEEDIIQALDGFPENKVHCSNLGVSALRNAIENHLNKNRTEDSYENSNSSR